MRPVVDHGRLRGLACCLHSGGDGRSLGHPEDVEAAEGDDEEAAKYSDYDIGGAEVGLGHCVAPI